jgi:hypothetical protein
MTERQFRTLITALLVFPLLLGIDAILHPIRPRSGDLRETFYPVFIIPILFLAYSVWVYPQHIREMFGPFRSESLLKNKQLTDLIQSISPQKKKLVLISAAIFGTLVFCTLINVSLFTLWMAGQKADTVPASRSGILSTPQPDERMQYPVPTDFETATVTESPTGAASQPEATTPIETPIATVGVTPSGTTPLTTLTKTPLTTAGVTPSGTTPSTTLTKTPSVSSTQQVCSVGTQCVVNGVGVTVINVSRINSIDTATPAAGNTYLVLNVIIQNVDSGESMLYDPAYFSVQDANGTQYPALSIAPEPVLSSGPLPQGGTADGNVAFEVKSASTGFVTLYAPPALNGSNPIRIGLGQ